MKTTTEQSPSSVNTFLARIEKGQIEIIGAKEHNLKDIDLKIPRNALVVFTGLSGSGKSSLAFDTLFAEGQRRYMETFMAYARQFMGQMKRPDVDKINGLSPVIAIEQKTVSKNPRSTVGTITEVYDFIRLLFARVADAYSPESGRKMESYTPEELLQEVQERYKGEKIIILAPLIRGRKGHYRELFERMLKNGFTHVWVDGEERAIEAGMKVERNKIHDISLVIDRLDLKKVKAKRLDNAVNIALRYGENSLEVQKYQSTEKPTFFSLDYRCPDTGKSYNPPEPNTFSFNSNYGRCEVCKGIGHIETFSFENLVENPKKQILNGGIIPIWKYFNVATQGKVTKKDFAYALEQDLGDLAGQKVGIFQEKVEGVDSENELLAYLNSMLEHRVFNNKKLSKDFPDLIQEVCCPACNGRRLKEDAYIFKIDDKDIGEVSEMEISKLFQWLKSLSHKTFQGKLRQKAANEILKEAIERTSFLMDVGLHYLSLNRPAGSLSGGEAQRIRLATQIGSELVNVLYILDEPSIGLHQRDNTRLINSLKGLRDLGNTVIVVEHDKEMMQAADFIVDLGPAAGKQGGEVVFAGTQEEMQQAKTLTVDYLKGTKNIALPNKRRPIKQKDQAYLKLLKCSGNNLKKVDLSLPLGLFIGVSGVSGSGKSTLINETLYPALHNHINRAPHKCQPYEAIEGLEYLDKVVNIDQSPIGRTPRSNPATYTGLFDTIRKLFAQVPDARLRGYKPGRFSFNVKGGRCEVCRGGGMKTIEMNFLPDVLVECDACYGKRYNSETLQVRYKGLNISEVLDLSIADAVAFFDAVPVLKRKLQTLVDVGLGYLKLGQSSTTLSGGEAQRVKLASELSKVATGKTLYILDEPTTGLHFEDIRILLKVLQKLVDKGNTVVVIEHNMDVLKTVDYLIDLGPEGGYGGGKIVAKGKPEAVAKSKKSETAPFLAEVLGN